MPGHEHICLVLYLHKPLPAHEKINHSEEKQIHANQKFWPKAALARICKTESVKLY